MNRVYSRRLSDDELQARLAATMKAASADGALWRLFEEGPEVSRVVARTANDACDVAGLWQLRLFRADGEMAARRLSFEDAGEWQVRLLGAAAQDCEDWEHADVTAGPSASLVLYGKYDPADRRFGEDRFARGRYSLPTDAGAAWESDDVAAVLTQAWQLADGTSLVAWQSIQRAGSER